MCTKVLEGLAILFWPGYIGLVFCNEIKTNVHDVFSFVGSNVHIYFHKFLFIFLILSIIICK